MDQIVSENHVFLHKVGCYDLNNNEPIRKFIVG